MREDYFNLTLRNNGYWYYYVYDKYGRRKFRSTGEKRKGKAMEIAIERSRTGELLEPKITKHVKFSEYAKDFWLYDKCPIIQDYIQRGRHFSAMAAQNNQYKLDKVIMKDFGSYYLEELTTAQIQSWLIRLPKKLEIASKTANDYYMDLRLILGQAVADGYIEKNPAENVKRLAKQSTGKGTFTPEQIQALFKTQWKCLPAYAACLLSAKTGMRLGEVRALTVEQIKDGYLEVNASWAEGGEGRKTTKSGYGRIVPVEEKLIALLKEIAPRSTGYVFTVDGVKPCHRSFITDKLFAEMKSLGIPREDNQGRLLSFHSFRYYCNTRMIVGNISAEKIRAVMGHESESMTEHYTRLNANDMKDICNIQKQIC